jgi:hypothetical protein
MKARINVALSLAVIIIHAISKKSNQNLKSPHFQYIRLPLLYEGVCQTKMLTPFFRFF